MSWPAVEQLVFEVPAVQLDAFFQADAAAWTPFLEQQAGFGGKMQLFNQTAANNAEGDNVSVTTLVFWETYAQWKAIPAGEKSQAYANFVNDFGSAGPAPSALPSNDGWRLYQNMSISSSSVPLGCVLSSSIGQAMCAQHEGRNDVGGGTSSCSDALPGYIVGSFITATLIILVGTLYILHLRARLRQQLSPGLKLSLLSNGALQ